MRKACSNPRCFKIESFKEETKQSPCKKNYISIYLIKKIKNLFNIIELIRSTDAYDAISREIFYIKDWLFISIRNLNTSLSN